MSAAGAGSNKKLYTILAYVLGWIGGLIFLFVGKDDPDVKWNAAQSLIIFGGLSIIIAVLDAVHLWPLGYLLGVVGFVFWVIFLIQSLQGNGEKIPAPLIGPTIAQYVDQLANAVK